MLPPRPTSTKCKQCGHNLDVTERPRECETCGSYPLCAVCFMAHAEDDEHDWSEDVGDGSDGR